MKTHLLPLVLALLMTSAGASAARPAHLLTEFSTTRLIIDTSTIRCIVFDVYVAQTGPQRQQGLMYVEELGTHEGMLFIYPQTARIRMWMKNTLISLDMLFVDENLQVAHIHRNAVPLSEDIIDSQTDVAAVIELNGGAAEYFGIATGNQIILSEL